MFRVEYYFQPSWIEVTKFPGLSDPDVDVEVCSDDTDNGTHPFEVLLNNLALLRSIGLERIPAPSIGFGLLHQREFRYVSFGTSYILEFPAPRWVECTYSAPYVDEEEEAEVDDPDQAATREAAFDAALGIDRNHKPGPFDFQRRATHPNPFTRVYLSE